MTIQALLSLPESFPAGTTVAYRRSLSDYPADAGWTLTLYLAGAGLLEVAGTADGDDHIVTISASASGDLAAGVYKWVERVSNAGGEVYQVASGVVTVTPDLTVASAGSQQEWLERAIAALKLHIEGRLPTGMESYQVAGRVISKMPIRDAIQVLASLEGRLARIADPGAITRPVLVHFTGAGFDQ